MARNDGVPPTVSIVVITAALVVAIAIFAPDPPPLRSTAPAAASAAPRSNNPCPTGYRPPGGTDWRRGAVVYAAPGEEYGTISDLRHRYEFPNGSKGMAVGIRFASGNTNYFRPSDLKQFGYLVRC